MSQPVEVRIAHQIRGRTRLVAASAAGRAALYACASRLPASPGVRIEVRPAAGSMVIHHAGPWPVVAERLQQAGLVLAPPRPQAAIGRASAAAACVNDGLERATGGRLDLTNTAFLFLLAAGALQMSRGQILAPAVTLFMQATTLAALQKSMSHV